MGKNDFFKNLKFLTRFPFNWKNPIGFTFAISIQYVINITTLIIGKCIGVFLFGTCVVLMLLTNDIKRGLQSINKNAGLKKQRFRIQKQLHELIQFHSSTRQLS